MFKHRRHSRFIGYLLGLATPLLVAAVMQLTWPFFEKAPVSFFLLAVMVSGWYGGLGPGLVCTGISLLIANYFFTPPYNSLWRPVEGDIVYLVALATMGGLTAVLTGLLHRTRTQAELRLDSFRRVIEEAPNGMVMVDDAGAVVLVNAAIETAFGYAREDLLGQPIEILIPERFRQKDPEYRKTFAARPTARAMGAGRDLFGLRKDGTEFPVEIGLTPLQMERGVMTLGTIVDITERKRIENVLRKSEEQLSGVINSAMEAIITVDQDQRIVLFNAAAERMFLVSAEKAMGESIERFIPERFRPNHRNHVRDFGRTHVTKRSMGALGAIFGLRADGQEFPIEASISQIVSDGKRLFTVILRDITKRKRAEEALREQAQMVDLAHVLIRDMNGHIIFWNAGSEQMYGWRAEEAMGKLCFELLQTEFPQALDVIGARLLTRGHWEGEVVHRRRDGGRIVVASHWVLYRDDDGEPKAVLEVNNDITELKQAEEEVRRFSEKLEQRVAARTAELEASNAELEAFSYSVSHDLRAPLRHLSGYADMLKRKNGNALDDTGRRYLEVILESANRMGNLIDHLLAFSRLGRADMQTAVVNLDLVLNLAINDLKSETEGRNIAWSLEKLPAVEGDAGLLRMVFVNLLSNAIKFTRSKQPAEIHVGSSSSNGEVTVFVRDNGAGFDMKYADKLFGVFQRLHRTDQFEGTGIGLANVRRIISRHGGNTWAESQNGSGATFYFSLPVAGKPTQQ